MLGQRFDIEKKENHCFRGCNISSLYACYEYDLNKINGIREKLGLEKLSKTELEIIKEYHSKINAQRGSNKQGYASLQGTTYFSKNKETALEFAKDERNTPYKGLEPIIISCDTGIQAFGYSKKLGLQIGFKRTSNELWLEISGKIGLEHLKIETIPVETKNLCLESLLQNRKTKLLDEY